MLSVFVLVPFTSNPADNFWSQEDDYGEQQLPYILVEFIGPDGFDTVHSRWALKGV